MRVVLVIVKITHFCTERKEKRNGYIALGINVRSKTHKSTVNYIEWVLLEITTIFEDLVYFYK